MITMMTWLSTVDKTNVNILSTTSDNNLTVEISEHHMNWLCLKE